MGTIRISVPPMQDDRLRRLFSGFLGAHPRVRLEIHSGTQMVDLQAGRFDLALRAGSGFHPGLIVRPLLRTRLLAVASPAYLDRHSAPAAPDDPRRHACPIPNRGIDCRSSAEARCALLGLLPSLHSFASVSGSPLIRNR